jgi:hypothetical protein
MAYAQSQTSEQATPQSQTQQQSEPQPQQPAQTSAPPPKPQQSNAQTPHQTNAAPPAPQPPKMDTIWHRFEVGGGYAHISGDGGMDGFNVGASFFLAPRVSLGFNYDSVYDTTTLGSFALTNVGATVSNNHMQDYMAGFRIYFPGVFRPNCVPTAVPVLHPFFQAQFGESNLYSKVTSVNIGTISTSDTRFTWLLGGGSDFRIDDHWSARVSADLVRTHFADVGQSRIRIILGVVGRF